MASQLPALYLALDADDAPKFLGKINFIFNTKLLQNVFHILALLTALKKWTFALSMPGVASRWHIFEANVNGFTLVLQAHGAKPLDDRAEQTLV